jgi:hypothetical protein
MEIWSVIRCIGDGLYLMDTPDGQILWSRCKTRKASSAGWNCVLCYRPIGKGVMAYRPIGNGLNRARRAHESCVEVMESHY